MRLKRNNRPIEGAPCYDFCHPIGIYILAMPASFK